MKLTVKAVLLSVLLSIGLSSCSTHDCGCIDHSNGASNGQIDLFDIAKDHDDMYLYINPGKEAPQSLLPIDPLDNGPNLPL